MAATPKDNAQQAKQEQQSQVAKLLARREAEKEQQKDCRSC